MSQFKKEDKEQIQKNILLTGEHFFSELGLKKTTAEQISNQVGIAKGTFYHFYPNKESLFLEIYIQKQHDLFAKALKCLYTTPSLPPREKCYQIMLIIINGFCNDPILSMTDTAMWKKIKSKVSKKLSSANDIADTAFFNELIKNGITFRYPLDLILEIIQLTCMNAVLLKQKNANAQKIEILLRGTIMYLVEEENEKEDSEKPIV